MKIASRVLWTTFMVYAAILIALFIGILPFMHANIIMTGSMVPTMPVGTMVFEVPVQHVAVGDVITI
jgi:signal peptidase I